MEKAYCCIGVHISGPCKARTPGKEDAMICGVDIDTLVFGDIYVSVCAVLVWIAVTSITRNMVSIAYKKLVRSKSYIPISANEFIQFRASEASLKCCSVSESSHKCESYRGEVHDGVWFQSRILIYCTTRWLVKNDMRKVCCKFPRLPSVYKGTRTKSNKSSISYSILYFVVKRRSSCIPTSISCCSTD
jgi:hypothetical protein